jgi:uncharacterized cupin superfamily protein
MTRLPRTIRLDSSDSEVFVPAAFPGEWAVGGGFLFMNLVHHALTAAQHNAFASGFLGTESFGWSTLVTVASASADDIELVTEKLEEFFRRELGAPTAEEARAVAEQEVRFAAGLCEHPVGTLLTVARRFEGEEIVESYATVTPDREEAR